MATVDLKDVKKIYPGGVEAVKGVNIAIPDKALCVLVGPSGCGKSTLLRMVAGLESISAGTCSFDGKVVNEISPTDRDIAMVFQNYALYPHMNVYDNMAYGLRNRGMPKDEIDTRVKQAAKTLELAHLLDRRPRQLSGGQRQRVAMGRAIVRNPKVFLFDEPLSNLDAKLRGQMRVEIKNLQRSLGVTSVYVTHDQLEAMTLADLLVVMNAGQVEQQGSPLDIYEKPASTFVASFIGAPPMNLVPVADGKFGDSSTVSAKAPAGATILGFRPEDADIAAGNGQAGGLLLDAVVEGVEPVGAESFLYCAAAGQRVVVRVSGRSPAQLGDRLKITTPVAKLHWFDKDGKRVEESSLLALSPPSRNKTASSREKQEMACVQGNRDAEMAGLLRAALAGDERAYARFLEIASSLIRAVVRRRAGQGAVDVEDVVQETLLAIHLKRHTWRSDAPVLPWLYAIARYKLIDAYRRKGRRIELDISEFSETLPAAEEDRISERDLGRVLEVLPAGQRSVVESISVDGRSIGETAAALNMNEGAVRVALHRGLKAIAKRFGQP